MVPEIEPGYPTTWQVTTQTPRAAIVPTLAADLTRPTRHALLRIALIHDSSKSSTLTPFELRDGMENMH